MFHFLTFILKNNVSPIYSFLLDDVPPLIHWGTRVQSVILKGETFKVMQGLVPFPLLKLWSEENVEVRINRFPGWGGLFKMEFVYRMIENVMQNNHSVTELLTY